MPKPLFSEKSSTPITEYCFFHLLLFHIGDLNISFVFDYFVILTICCPVVHFHTSKIRILARGLCDRIFNSILPASLRFSHNFSNLYLQFVNLLFQLAIPSLDRRLSVYAQHFRSIMIFLLGSPAPVNGKGSAGNITSLIGSQVQHSIGNVISDTPFAQGNIAFNSLSSFQISN